MSIQFGDSYAIINFRNRHTGQKTPINGASEARPLLSAWQSQLRQAKIREENFKDELVVIDPLHPPNCLYLSEGDTQAFRTLTQDLFNAEVPFKNPHLSSNKRHELYQTGLSRIIRNLLACSEKAEVVYNQKPQPKQLQWLSGNPESSRLKTWTPNGFEIRKLVSD